jgi:hypothetical protein
MNFPNFFVPPCKCFLAPYDEYGVGRKPNPSPHGETMKNIVANCMKPKEIRAVTTRPMLARLLHIRRRIESGSYPTRCTLAEELEVSTRTIARDMEFLRDTCGDTISYVKTRNGWCHNQAEMYGMAQPMQTVELEFLAGAQTGSNG